jgi:DNA-binding NtrC family response regulator
MTSRRYSLRSHDLRMPGMLGTDYLIEEHKLMPNAKRVLLTAYADIGTAISVRVRGFVTRFRVRP